jgi:hypothetical protein
MTSSDTEIRVAVARGPGAGRFLAMALVDVLQSGMPLVAVRVTTVTGSDPRSGVDFVFYQEDAEREEVIRAGLTSDGRVVSAEIVRRAARRHEGPCQAAEALLAALRSGETVSEIHWQHPPEAGPDGVLSLTVRSEHRFEIACGPRQPRG